MAIPFLADIEHYGNKSMNVVLDAAKFTEGAPATPQIGHFYTVNGVLHYRNPANVELPVHENAIRDISAVGPVSAVTNGTAVQLSIATATTTTDGVIDAASYALLAGANSTSGPNTLVRRDANGAIAVGDLSAGIITATNITGLSANPQGDGSAASVAYVDNLVQQSLTAASRGMLLKTPPVRVAVNTNLPLTSVAGTYDGVTLAVNDSLLLIGQINSAENGAYIVTANGLVRRADSNTAALLAPGSIYEVLGGTYTQNLFVVAATDGYRLNTDPITFVNISGVNTIIDGDGMSKTGQVLNVVGTPDRILVDATKVDIAPTYIGQTSITTVGTISQGTWNGAPVGLAFGGTGETTLVGVKDNLGISYELVFILGDGQGREFPITHNLANSFPTVTGFYTIGSTSTPVGAIDYTIVDSNRITVKASLGSDAIPANSLTVIIRAESNGSDYTNAPRPNPTPAPTPAPAGYGG